MLNVAVLDNPSPFGNPFQFEITFECMEDLPEGEYCFLLTCVCVICKLTLATSVGAFCVIGNFYVVD